YPCRHLRPTLKRQREPTARSARLTPPCGVSMTTSRRAGLAAWNDILRQRGSLMSTRRLLAPQDQTRWRPQAQEEVVRPRQRRFPASPARRGLELLRHPHQFGERPSLHLPHHLAPMHLDGDLAGAELGGDLLVQHARYHQAHDLALARRQQVVPFAQTREILFAFPRDA